MERKKIWTEVAIGFCRWEVDRDFVESGFMQAPGWKPAWFQRERKGECAVLLESLQQTREEK